MKRRDDVVTFTVVEVDGVSEQMQSNCEIFSYRLLACFVGLLCSFLCTMYTCDSSLLWM